MRHRSAGRGPLAAGLGLVIGLGICPLATAGEITGLFGSSQEPASSRQLSADETVQRAFDNLFPDNFAMQIRTTRGNGSGPKEVAEFRVYRRAMNGAERIMTESISPPSIAGSRMLQVEQETGSEETFAFVRSASPDPFSTTFRLADPFLCSWHDKSAASGPRRRLLRRSSDSGTPGFRPDFEILGRRPDLVADERVQRILVRPQIDRGYDRAELAISEKDFAILEYRYFAGESDTEPSLVARVKRSEMRQFGRYLLPIRMRYEDRARGERIEVSIEHQALTDSTPDTLFDPRSFHRPRTTPLTSPEAP